MIVGFERFSLKLEKMIDSQSLRVQYMFSGTVFKELLKFRSKCLYLVSYSWFY